MRQNSLEHPPYCPNLSPCDYHLFIPLKEALGGQHFENNHAVETFVRECLTTKPSYFYKKKIMGLPKRWKNIIFNTFV